MKISKWLGASAAVLALGAAGFIAVPSANASAPTITAGAGSNVTCTVVGSVKLSPGLTDPWLHSQHSGANADPSTNATVKAAMASIPDDATWVAGDGAGTPVTTSSKSTATCTGTITDGTNTDTSGLAASITSTSVSDGTNPAECSSLSTNTGSSTLTSIIKWAGTPDKIAPSTVTSTVSQLIDSHGAGFEITPVAHETTGSFANGSGVTKAYVDITTIGALSEAPTTFGAPTSGGDVCEPSVSEKFTAATTGASDAIALKLKKPKGLKAITIGPALDNTASTLTSCVAPATC